LRDSAALLERAMRLGSSGKREQAVALLTEAIRLSPKLWQAYQHRGSIYLEQPARAGEALRDFTEAIRLAPEEGQLYLLRGQAYSLMGQEAPARADLETAAALSPPQRP
jgi:Flp pilus assembly protein TadD